MIHTHLMETFVLLSTGFFVLFFHYLSSTLLLLVKNWKILLVTHFNCATHCHKFIKLVFSNKSCDYLNIFLISSFLPFFFWIFFLQLFRLRCECCIAVRWRRRLKVRTIPTGTKSPSEYWNFLPLRVTQYLIGYKIRMRFAGDGVYDKKGGRWRMMMMVRTQTDFECRKRVCVQWLQQWLNWIFPSCEDPRFRLRPTTIQGLSDLVKKSVTYQWAALLGTIDAFAICQV